MDLIIRRAVGSDAEPISSLYLRARAAGAASGTIPEPVHAAAEVERWVVGVVIAQRECWVAEHGGELLGLLVLEADWIDQLYVDPDHTGQGIGSRLIAVAKRQRRGGLRVWTFAANEGAQRFYRRHAFLEVQRSDGARNEERAPDVQYAWIPQTENPQECPVPAPRSAGSPARNGRGFSGGAPAAPCQRASPRS